MALSRLDALRHVRMGYVIAGMMACVSVTFPSRAQTVDLPTGAIDVRQLQQLQQLQSLQPQNAPAQAERPVLDASRDRAQPAPTPTPAPAPASRNVPAASAVEAAYSGRAGVEVRQFGYDMIGSGSPARALLAGAIPNDYVLGIGDELVVTLRGQINRTSVVRVDREGRVVINDLQPIPAAGRTFEEFRGELESRVATAFLKTEIFVSLGAVRSITVLVTGEVGQPGQHSLTSMSSILDALATAGGIQKSGTLRDVRLLRDGVVQQIDLYSLLIPGTGSPSLRLRDGDQIIVPTLGPTVAVVGDIVKPGIYEFMPSQRTETVAGMLERAGGPNRPEGNRLTILRLDDAGRNKQIELDSRAGSLKPGDVLVVGLPLSAFSIDGASDLPGQRSTKATTNLADLLKTPGVLAADPYLPFAVIQTEDPLTRVRRFVSVNLESVLAGRTNVALRQRDRLIILSQADVQYLISADVQAVLRGEVPPSLIVQASTPNGSPDPEVPDETGPLARYKPAAQRPLIGYLTSPESKEARPVQTGVQCDGLRTLSAVSANGMLDRFVAATRIVQAGKTAIVDVQACPDIFNRFPDLLPFVLEHTVAVEGEVRRPGILPVVPQTPVDVLLRAVGGLTFEADANTIELSKADGERQAGIAREMIMQASVSPGDVIRVNPRVTLREQGTVEVRGQVLRPGRYNIQKGEKLSDLIRRVGGITSDAFTYGAVFTRERVRVAEKEGFERVARELELSLPAALAQAANDPNATRNILPALQGLVANLRATPALGRVVIEADPTVLAAKPELDFVLEPGDRLIIPKRPVYVTISGEVLNPSTVMFKSGLAARHYIRLAGGPGQAADMGRAFVVYPNGESAPLSLGTFSDGNVPIPPGSTIVVPRDPLPFSLFTITRNITQVLSDIALTAASLSVISSN